MSRSTRMEDDSALVRTGRKYMASISNSMVTTSTDSWVNARSGAEKRTNSSDTISPTTLNDMIEVIRWRCSMVVSNAPATSMAVQRIATPSIGSIATSRLRAGSLPSWVSSTTATRAINQAT